MERYRSGPAPCYGSPISKSIQSLLLLNKLNNHVSFPPSASLYYFIYRPCCRFLSSRLFSSCFLSLSCLQSAITPITNINGKKYTKNIGFARPDLHNNSTTIYMVYCFNSLNDCLPFSLSASNKYNPGANTAARISISVFCTNPFAMKLL